MFLGMMILPGLLFIPLKDYVDTENYENRVYQEKPVLNFRNLRAADLKSYPGQYDAYFNDHLAFKNPIVAFGKLADIHVKKFARQIWRARNFSFFLFEYRRKNF